MSERDTKRTAAAAVECPIAKLVIKREARRVVQRFLEGETLRRLARDNGLSRTGIEQLIRVHSRMTADRRARR